MNKTLFLNMLWICYEYIMIMSLNYHENKINTKCYEYVTVSLNYNLDWLAAVMI